MQIVALEEHWVTQRIRQAWAAAPPELHDDSVGILDQFGIGERLEDTGSERIRAMDDAGIDVQVLSLAVPGLHNFDPQQAVTLGRHANDTLAAVVAGNPDRFQAFAAIATADPQEGADELQRAVTLLGFKGALINGRTRDRNMDAAEFDPVYAMAAKLRVPIYIHPQLPVKAVRDAYYHGFAKPVDIAFAGGGLGWFYETGIQFIRLILSGTLDRHPDLQFILGHWGEVVLFYLDRLQMLDLSAKLDRPMRDYFLQNAYYTPSGMLSQPDLKRTIEMVGAERVMFSSDYPYIYAMHRGMPSKITERWVNLDGLPGGGARRFIEQSGLSLSDQALIASGNWNRLVAAARTATPA